MTNPRVESNLPPYADGVVTVRTLVRWLAKQEGIADVFAADAGNVGRPLFQTTRGRYPGSSSSLDLGPRTLASTLPYLEDVRYQ